MSFLRKHLPSEEPSKHESFVDVAFQSSYPALSEFLTVAVYPDGSPRQLSTLTLFRDDGQWKACLNDKDNGTVLFVTENTYGTLLEALEILLQEERPPWRKSTFKPNKGPRKGGTGS